MSQQPASQMKVVNGKKVKVYSLVLITDEDKRTILLGLKKRGERCGAKFNLFDFEQPSIGG